MNRTSWNCVPDPVFLTYAFAQHRSVASAATGTGSTAGLKWRGASFVQDADAAVASRWRDGGGDGNV